MKQYVKDNQMSERVHFLGNLQDAEVMACYQNCDVFILPSVARSEAFGLVQIEAMSYGKPIINTRLASGVPYVSLHGQTGLTVETENIEQLTKAMRWMVEHPEERQRMSRAARKRVEEEFLTGTMLKRILGVCRK